MTQRRSKLCCQQCGDEFEVRIYQIERTKFCSRKCMAISFEVPVTIGLIQERFATGYKPGAPDECWEWFGKMGNTGYGVISIGDKFRQASHRVSYLLNKGDIPFLPGYHGAVVRHTCDNRLCVNPNHLIIGTQADNVADQIERGKMPWSHR